MKQTCSDCSRKAKYRYTYHEHGEEIPVFKCGYHTWWFGTTDYEHAGRLKEQYKIV